jgi:hypothetical protein
MKKWPIFLAILAFCFVYMVLMEQRTKYSIQPTKIHTPEIYLSQIPATITLIKSIDVVILTTIQPTSAVIKETTTIQPTSTVVKDTTTIQPTSTVVKKTTTIVNGTTMCCTKLEDYGGRLQVIRVVVHRLSIIAGPLHDAIKKLVEEDNESEATIIKANIDLGVGGAWKPSNCIAKSRVSGFIHCYRPVRTGVSRKYAPSSHIVLCTQISVYTTN